VERTFLALKIEETPNKSLASLNGASDLIAAQIRRANPSIDREAAQKLSAELRDLIDRVRTYCGAHPCDTPIGPLEESDVIETLLRTSVGFWPSDEAEAASESIWIMERLVNAGGDELYLRYMRLYDRVNATERVKERGLDAPNRYA
jgi:hypothetical protein